MTARVTANARIAEVTGTALRSPAKPDVLPTRCRPATVPALGSITGNPPTEVGEAGFHVEEPAVRCAGVGGSGVEGSPSARWAGTAGLRSEDANG